MEGIKGERGRARAGKRAARPETGLGGAVHSIIAEAASLTPREWAALGVYLGGIMLCGFLEGSTWPM